MTDVQKHSVHTLVFRSLKRTHDTFLSEQGNPPAFDPSSQSLRTTIKAKDEYGPVMHLVKNTEFDRDSDAVTKQMETEDIEQVDKMLNNQVKSAPDRIPRQPVSNQHSSQALVLAGSQQQALVPKKPLILPRPNWHPPWKLYRVISGHLGWVRSIAFEPGNQWFATGAGDRVIKIWDLASGKLKLSLTGHISSVRGLAVSSRQPYLFSCGEDKQVKCWDLEYNKVIRHYHGHLSACYALDLHPTIDVLVSCGRDSVARVWDIRTKANVHTLGGHTNTVADVKCQSSEPQIITASHDSTIRLWDLAAGKTKATLTNHKKSVRSLVIHPKLNMFGSVSPDNIKQWRCPEGKFVQNLTGHNAIINCLGMNSDGVLVSGADNGTLHFWDWRTGFNFQRLQAPVQPGSIDSEAGIFACKFDHSGSRLITCEADKTIKIYKEDDTASEESHPINWKPDILKRRRY